MPVRLPVGATKAPKSATMVDSKGVHIVIRSGELNGVSNDNIGNLSKPLDNCPPDVDGTHPEHNFCSWSWSCLIAYVCRVNNHLALQIEPHPIRLERCGLAGSTDYHTETTPLQH